MYVHLYVHFNLQGFMYLLYFKHKYRPDKNYLDVS